jgi:small acid-soluble spore protein I (minor)
MSIISFERNDFMNIKDYIIQNFKDDNLETIEKAIDDSVNEYNEDTLPGLGIFFMLVWENSNKEEKNTILEKIKSNLN